MSSLNREGLLDSLISIALILFLLLYPLVLHPLVYASALGLVPSQSIKNLDFFYEPRAYFLFWSCSLILIFWSFRFYKTGSWGHQDKGMDVFLLFLILTALASTLFSLEPLTLFGAERRREGFLSLLSYYSLFLLAQDFLSKHKWRRIALSVILFSGLLVSLYGILQAFSIEILPRDFIRADWTSSFSTIGNPIFLGSYLLLLIPIPLYFLPKSKPWKKLALIFLSLFFAVALVLTGSRGAWIGLAALFLFWLFTEKNRKLYYLVFSILLILLIFLFLTTSFTRINLWERLKAAFNFVPQNTLINRLYIWKRALPAILQHPIFGWGPDSFGVAFPQFTYEESLKLFNTGYAYVDKAHNDLIQIAVTLGISGLLAYLAFLVRLFSLAYPHRNSDPLLKYTLPGLFGYLVSLELSFSVVSVAPLFWVLAGISIGGLKNYEQAA
jgi:putative inorganic carbon (HCO3(-)) transporter